VLQADDSLEAALAFGQLVPGEQEDAVVGQLGLDDVTVSRVDCGLSSPNPPNSLPGSSRSSEIKPTVWRTPSCLVIDGRAWKDAEEKITGS
jgi:hypothetical protein